MHIHIRKELYILALCILSLLSACAAPISAVNELSTPKATISAPTAALPIAKDSPAPTAPTAPIPTIAVPDARSAGSAPFVQITSEGYLTNKSELQQRKQLADQGFEPYKSAVDQLLNEAKDALDIKPKARKNLVIPKDSDSRQQELVDASQGTYILAMAYQLTGDERYAEHARDLMMVWPEQNKTISTDENTPLVVSNTLPAMVWGADLLDSYDGWTNDDRASFKNWLSTVVLPRASDRENNWGDWGILLRLTITRYTGDTQGFGDAITRWKQQIDGVNGIGGIASDGHMPEETRREDSGITYTSFALNAKLAAAVIAQRAGVDVWSYTNPQGGNLKQALDFIAPYVLDPANWPYYDGEAKTSVHPVWEIAYQHWQEPIYAQIAAQRRPYGYKDIAVSWTTLTNGIPFSQW